jgi:arylsulfatase
MDPYERADIVSDQYYDWFSKNDYLLVKGQLKAAAFLQTFVEYPPSQRPASFNVEGVRKQVDKAIDQSFKARGIEK